MLVVLDANVLVSALISSRGSPGRILELWMKDRFDLLISPPILAEVQRIIHYPKIQLKYNLPEEHVKQYLDNILSQAIFINPALELEVIIKDPSDNRYLECAQEGNASYLVTGDKHLLELEEYMGIVIIPPVGFLAMLAMEDKENSG